MAETLDNKAKKEKQVEAPKCFTEWEVFDEAMLVPTSWTCCDYFPMHRIDGSCHTKFPITIENILRHMSPEHNSGGGFRVELKQSEKPTNIWKELKAAGVELHDFRCDVCGIELPLAPRRILKHLQPHAGKTHNVTQGGGFMMTLRFDSPLEGDKDGF